MSTNGGRDYRPFRYYAPPAGWRNDPNGLTYDKGVWHLFAQHYPDETIWSPMYWIHATSSDLVNWQQQGIALSILKNPIRQRRPMERARSSLAKKWTK